MIGLVFKNLRKSLARHREPPRPPSAAPQAMPGGLRREKKGTSMFYANYHRYEKEDDGEKLIFYLPDCLPPYWLTGLSA